MKMKTKFWDIQQFVSEEKRFSNKNRDRWSSSYKIGVYDILFCRITIIQDKICEKVKIIINF